jgi:hypothetical protein
MGMMACKKSNTGNNGDPNPPVQVSNTTGNTTNYNGYVVKTIGISRILLAVDNNNKITLASMYGGGNKIILKTGTGNTMAITNPLVITCPDNLLHTPDGIMPFSDDEIDNGKLLDTGSTKTVIKLKGFDKSKTGYNQINIVMCKYLWPANLSPGYQNNVTYLKMTEASGTKNADYATDFVGKLFSGNINVSSVEMAPPLSASTYITEDQIVSAGQVSYDVATNKNYSIDLKSLFYRFFNWYQLPVTNVPYTNTLKLEWVNTTTGTVTSTDPYVYTAKFNNIKVGGYDQVVEPSDTASKVFLRVTGFDRSVFGYNQLRLFLASDGFYDGGLQVIYNAIPTTTPTFASIRDIYKYQGLYCELSSPLWPHY